ncbi:triose-phosphate isomerase [Fulvivirga sp. RKSG066]|uniref:triose-phosphate isomerase n=1 Tax=Fulvivirga aurantia TaxID=2529383 RepID=UPI0016286129|nr:triose-phosphate isomerase [Fulvivirga aurantia]
MDEGLKLTSEIVNMVEDEVSSDVKVILAPPFVHLSQVKNLIKGSSKLFLSAQNCSQHNGGGVTGEISTAMLKSTGVQYVIIGHSERREYFNETNEQLAQKVDAALANGLTPIFCCGEPLEIREAGTYIDYVQNQLKESLFHLPNEAFKNIVIAYEPIWAIGTGKTASSDQAQEMHAAIRTFLVAKYGDVAKDTSLLYGGSCKPSNAKELFACNDVDGGLIGGASLKSRDFTDIVKSF